MNAIHWLWWSGALAICTSLAVWAIIGDRARGRLRCPKCWYDMQGHNQNDHCPECGFESKSQRDWTRTRRRRKTAVLSFLVALLISIVAFREPLLVYSVHDLPDTALIVLLNRVEVWQIEDELRSRLTEGDRRFVYRWNRGALWNWQWKLLGERLQPTPGVFVYNSLTDACDVFTESAISGAIPLSPEQIGMAVEDKTGQSFRDLHTHLGLPLGSILPQFTDLRIKSTVQRDIHDREAQFFLIQGSQTFELFASNRIDDQWFFAGNFNVHSKYSDPTIRALDDDPTILEIRNMTTGGTGTSISTTAWLQVRDDGLQLIHHWPTNGHMFYSRAPFNYTFQSTATRRGEDSRGPFVDHTIEMTITNDGCIWENTLPADVPDIAAVQDLYDVYTRTGVARYRWDDVAGKYQFSERESDWTAAQIDDYLYTDNRTFLEQNFNTLVELATGDIPAERAWVRLVLTRLDDSSNTQRLKSAIDDADR